MRYTGGSTNCPAPMHRDQDESGSSAGLATDMHSRVEALESRERSVNLELISAAVHSEATSV